MPAVAEDDDDDDGDEDALRFSLMESIHLDDCVIDSHGSHVILPHAGIILKVRRRYTWLGRSAKGLISR